VPDGTGTVHPEGSLVLGDPSVRRIADIGPAAFGDATCLKPGKGSGVQWMTLFVVVPQRGFRLETGCPCGQMLHSA
jgi:hypothetical protein